jgi:hypothetical protein
MEKSGIKQRLLWHFLHDSNSKVATASLQLYASNVFAVLLPQDICYHLGEISINTQHSKGTIKSHASLPCLREESQHSSTQQRICSTLRQNCSSVMPRAILICLQETSAYTSTCYKVYKTMTLQIHL